MINPAQVSCAEATSVVRSTGSVKACYGHTEGAAGIHGAMLAVLAVQGRGVPSVMHSRQLNPYVDAAVGDWQAASNVTGIIPRVPPRNHPMQGSSAEALTQCVPVYTHTR